MILRIFILLPLTMLSSLLSVEGFEWGGELRSDTISLRNVPAEFSRSNGETLPKINFFRQRIQFWGEMQLSEKAAFRLSTMHEFREYFDGETPDKDYSIPSEIIIKTAYFDYQLQDNVKLRLGRQDIKYGAGRILWDPNPLDGSRTSFLDALKLSWTVKKTQLDFTLF